MIEKTKYEKNFRVKKGDEVMVIAGKSKGQTGKIDRVDLKKDRVYIAGVNTYKKHQKPGGNSEGGIVDKAMSIHVSNVALVDPKSKKPTRVGYKIEGEKKIRFAKNSGTNLN